jgi:tRNA U34 5-methylaminomethyl-2-thiouridine-forming methyltransferase MnmC
MQPGLRRLAPGAAQLTPLAPGSRHQREKLAVLSSLLPTGAGGTPGFDAGAGTGRRVPPGGAEHPQAWAWDGQTATALQGWACACHRRGRSVCRPHRCLRPGRRSLALPGACPPDWRLPALLSLAFAEDLAVVDASDGTIPWLAVALPSHWAPEDQGRPPLRQRARAGGRQQPAARAGEALTRLVTGPERWERFVWNVTDQPAPAHPPAARVVRALVARPAGPGLAARLVPQRAADLHVFVVGPSLAQRWAGRGDFTVVDLAFDVGHTFLVTWQAWRDDPARPNRLHHVAVVPGLPTVESLQHLVSDGAEPQLVQQMMAVWPPAVDGLHALDFEQGAVRLLLAVGPLRRLLPELSLRADAFFLGPATADRHLLLALARRAGPRATATAERATPALTDGLTAAGFDIQVPAGPGSALQAHHAPRWATRPAAPTDPDRRVVVIGAGLAGACTAAALATRGYAVQVLDRHAEPAAGSSGNPAGLFHATVHGDDSPYARLFRAAALHTARVLRPLDPLQVPHSADGLLRLEHERGCAAMLTLIDQQQLPPDFVQALDADLASRRAGVALTAPAWFCTPTDGRLAVPSRHTLARLVPRAPGLHLACGAQRCPPSPRRRPLVDLHAGRAQQWRAGEDAHRHHAGPLVDLGLHRQRVGDLQAAHVQDGVAVVGQHAGPQRGRAAQGSEAPRDLRCGHRDHLHRQRVGAQHGHQLALVGDADKALGQVGHDLLARQRGAAALDHVALGVDLVGAVDVDGQPLDLGGFQHADAMRRAAVRCWRSELDTAPAMRSLHRGQRVDEVVDGGAGAHAHQGAGHHVPARRGRPGP